jgi:hypothetical protein
MTPTPGKLIDGRCLLNAPDEVCMLVECIKAISCDWPCWGIWLCLGMTGKNKGVLHERWVSYEAREIE